MGLLVPIQKVVFVLMPPVEVVIMLPVVFVTSVPIMKLHLVLAVFPGQVVLLRAEVPADA